MNFLDETCRGQVMGLIRARARTRETRAGIQPSGPDISSSEWGRRRGTKWEGGDRARLFQGEDKLSKGGGGEKSHDGKAPTDDKWGAVTRKGPVTCAEHTLCTISNV